MSDHEPWQRLVQGSFIWFHCSREFWMQVATAFDSAWACIVIHIVGCAVLRWDSKWNWWRPVAIRTIILVDGLFHILISNLSNKTNKRNASDNRFDGIADWSVFKNTRSLASCIIRSNYRTFATHERYSNQQVCQQTSKPATATTSHQVSAPSLPLLARGSSSNLQIIHRKTELEFQYLPRDVDASAVHSSAPSPRDDSSPKSVVDEPPPSTVAEYTRTYRGKTGMYIIDNPSEGNTYRSLGVHFRKIKHIRVTSAQVSMITKDATTWQKILQVDQKDKNWMCQSSIVHNNRPINLLTH